ncbi:hypothetical protein ACET3Z_010615 [Daucus carota]
MDLYMRTRSEMHQYEAAKCPDYSVEGLSISQPVENLDVIDLDKIVDESQTDSSAGVEDYSSPNEVVQPEVKKLKVRKPGRKPPPKKRCVRRPVFDCNVEGENPEDDGGNEGGNEAGNAADKGAEEVGNAHEEGANEGGKQSGEEAGNAQVETANEGAFGEGATGGTEAGNEDAFGEGPFIGNWGATDDNEGSVGEAEHHDKGFYNDEDYDLEPPAGGYEEMYEEGFNEMDEESDEEDDD